MCCIGEILCDFFQFLKMTSNKEGFFFFYEKRNFFKERKKPRSILMLAYPLVQCISRQRTCVDTIQSNRRLTRKKFPSLSCRLSTLRRLILGKRSARGGCEREEATGVGFSLTPSGGSGQICLNVPPDPGEALGQLSATTKMPSSRRGRSPR